MTRSIGKSLARAGLAVALLCLWAESTVPEPGEPLFWRWIRVLAWHPARCGLALFLVDQALTGTVRPSLEGTNPSSAARGARGPKLG